MCVCVCMCVCQWMAWIQLLCVEAENELNLLVDRPLEGNWFATKMPERKRHCTKQLQSCGPRVFQFLKLWT